MITFELDGKRRKGTAASVRGGRHALVYSFFNKLTLSNAAVARLQQRSSSFAHHLIGCKVNVVTFPASASGSATVGGHAARGKRSAEWRLEVGRES
jgi:hypothetical protein